MKVIVEYEALRRVVVQLAVNSGLIGATRVNPGRVGRRLEVLIRGVNNVNHQRVCVENTKGRTGPAALDDGFEAGAIFEHGVDAGAILLRLAVVECCVCLGLHGVRRW